MSKETKVKKSDLTLDIELADGEEITDETIAELNNGKGDDE